MSAKFTPFKGFLSLFALAFLIGGCNAQNTQTPYSLVPDETDVSSEKESSSSVEDVPELGAEPQPESAPPDTEAPLQVKTFELTAKQWEFIPSSITVSKGDRVKLVIASVDVDHGIAIPDFNVRELLFAGTTTTVEFVADKQGTFTFFCSELCGSGHGDMKGTLIVQ